MGKVIVLDGSPFIFAAAYVKGSLDLKKAEGKIRQNTFIAPRGHTVFNMIISTLKRIGVDRDDIIIVALDARNSLRKAFYSIYKGDRAEKRKEQKHINWDQVWADYDRLINQLKESTDWNFVKFDNVYTLDNLLKTKEGKELIGNDYEDWQREKDYGLESDDIQAIACKVFPDKEIIIVTGDKDLFQLTNYPNVKIWYIKYKKIKGGSGGYAIIDNPLNIIAEKVRLGDRSDHIKVNKLHDTELEQKKRKFVIDLLNMPDWIENEIRVVLEDLPKKEIYLDKLPYQDSLAKRFNQIYQKKNVVTYQYCKELLEKKEIERKEKVRIKYYEKKGLPVPEKILKKEIKK